MASLDFDDYDNILSSLDGSQRKLHLQQQQGHQTFGMTPAPNLNHNNYNENGTLNQQQQGHVINGHILKLQQQQQQQPTLQNLQQRQQQQQTQDFMTGPQRFGSTSSSSNVSSDMNFNDFNDAVSSLSGSIVSPYSSGSSPDDFFLNDPVANANANNPNFVPIDANLTARHNQNWVGVNTEVASQSAGTGANAPGFVPMGESMSTSTVTYNTASIFDPGNTNNNNNNNSNSNVNNINANNSAAAPATANSGVTSPNSKRRKRSVGKKMKVKVKKEPGSLNLSKIKSNDDYSNGSVMNSPASRGRKKSGASVRPKNEASVKNGGRKIKCSHNLIEKKYRTNINSKIVELRNCVPSLRILISRDRAGNRNAGPGSASGSNGTDGSGNMDDLQFDDDYVGKGYSDDERKLDGLKPARKLNKATILSKATEYIRHLEIKNEQLVAENEKLKELLIASGNATFDMMQEEMASPTGNSTGIHSSKMQPSGKTRMDPSVRAPSSLSSHHPASALYSDSSYTSSPSINSSNGQVSPAQSMAAAGLNNSGSSHNSMNSNLHPLANKVLLGGMACMLGGSAMDDFSYNSGTGHRGLFAIPVVSFGSGETFAFNSSAFRPFLGLAKVLICIYVLYYTFLSSLHLYALKQRKDSSNTANRGSSALSSIASVAATTLMNPRSIFHSLDQSQAEQLLVLSIKHKTNISLKDVLSILNVRSSGSPNGNFLKSMCLKYVSETLQSGSSKSNDILSVATRLIATFFVDPLGQSYWRQASKKAISISQKGSKDSSNIVVLARLLQCFQYSDVDLQNISVVYNYRAGLVRLVAIYICEKLTVRAEKSMIRCLALEDKLEQRSKATDGTLSEEEEDEEDEEVEVAERHVLTNAEIKSEIITSRNECESDLRLLNTFDDTIPMELKLKAAILQYFLHPDEGEQLAKCFDLARASGQICVEFDVKLALTCCALEYKLLKTPSDYESLISWVSKLRLPSFTSNFRDGSQLSLFGFVSLLNVFSVLTYDILECLDKVEQKERSSDASSVNSEFSTLLAEDSADEGLETGTDIPMINFKLLNVVANMRIFAGNNRRISELGLDDDLRNQVIDGLVGYISHLNGL